MDIVAVWEGNGKFGGMDDCIWALWPERCSLAHGDKAMKKDDLLGRFMDVAADLLFLRLLAERSYASKGCLDEPLPHKLRS